MVVHHPCISEKEANEGAAAAGLKTFNGMLRSFKKCNYQGRNRSYPQGYGPETNSGKYCALYYEINSAGERVTFIGVADAHADCRADGDTDTVEEMGFYQVLVGTTNPAYLATFQMRPKHDYWFGLMMYYDNGKKKIPYDNTYSKDHYAMVAFPADYGSTGELTFIINEKGFVYMKDLGKSEYLDTYPGPNPVEHGWEIEQ